MTKKNIIPLVVIVVLAIIVAVLALTLGKASDMKKLSGAAQVVSFQANEPNVITLPATNITPTTAMLGAQINLAGLATSLSVPENKIMYWFTYSTHQYFAGPQTRTIFGTPLYVYQAQQTTGTKRIAKDLQTNVLYYYRVCAGTTTRVACGNVSTFTPTGTIAVTPTIQILSPNGGEEWRFGDNRTISWTTTNAPAGAWIRFVMTEGDMGCIGTRPAVPGTWQWTIPDTFWDCGDAGYTVPADTTYTTKLKAYLMTGTQPCMGYPAPGNPCIGANPTLHATDESDTFFTISNEDPEGTYPLISFRSAQAIVNPVTGTTNDMGVFDIDFEITAVDGDIYIPKLAHKALGYSFVRAPGFGVTQGTAAALVNMTSSDLTVNNNYRIEEGETERFRLSGVVVLPTAGPAGQYRMNLSRLFWSDIDSNITPDTNTEVTYQTNYITLN